MRHGSRTISGISNNKMKPETQITVNWAAASAGSGSISSYELRYTVNGGSSYTTVSSNIGVNTRSYSFTPSVKEGQTLIVQIRSKNSYGKYSSYENYPSVSIYADGSSVAKIGGNMEHVRAYAKVSGSMKKIKSIKVKKNGTIYNIDQYTPPN